jgi:hypothetical protein
MKTKNHSLYRSASIEKQQVTSNNESKDLQRNVSTSGFEIDASTVRRRLLHLGRKARKPIKKQLLTSAMKQKRLAWANKYRSWTTDDWKKVAFSDESHHSVQGY